MHTWFLEITLVQMLVCVCVCVRARARARPPPGYENLSCEMKPEWPIKQVLLL